MVRRMTGLAAVACITACTGIAPITPGVNGSPPAKATLTLTVDGRQVGLAGETTAELAAGGEAVYITVPPETPTPGTYSLYLSLVGNKPLQPGFTIGDLNTASLELHQHQADGKLTWVSGTNLGGLKLESTTGRFHGHFAADLRSVTPGQRDAVTVELAFDGPFPAVFDPLTMP